MRTFVLSAFVAAVVWGCWSPGAMAQSVVNWGAVTDGKAPSLNTTSSAPLTTVETVVPPPIPAPLTIRQQAQQAPFPDVSRLSSGYTHGEGEESSIRLDAGMASPELIARYAQQPGETESAYIERMARLYRQSQAQLEESQRRNEDYLRSLAPAPRSTAPPAG